MVAWRVFSCSHQLEWNQYQRSRCIRTDEIEQHIVEESRIVFGSRGAHRRRCSACIKLRMRLADGTNCVRLISLLGICRTSQIVLFDSKKEKSKYFRVQGKVRRGEIVHSSTSNERIEISFGAAIVLFLHFKIFRLVFFFFSFNSLVASTLNRFKIHYNIFRISSVRLPFRSPPFSLFLAGKCIQFFFSAFLV